MWIIPIGKINLNLRKDIGKENEIIKLVYLNFLLFKITPIFNYIKN